MKIQNVNLLDVKEIIVESSTFKKRREWLNSRAIFLLLVPRYGTVPGTTYLFIVMII
jgi:hypothetical protein